MPPFPARRAETLCAPVTEGVIASCTSPGEPENKFSRSLGTDRTCRGAEVQALLDRIPIDVGEEGFDVLGPLCGLILKQVSMLPHIHHHEEKPAMLPTSWRVTQWLDKPFLTGSW